jgi:hypothetical protein
MSRSDRRGIGSAAGRAWRARVLGARVWRSEGLARPVFRTTPRWLQMPGRWDMLARVGLSPRSRVGDFMPYGGDPLTGWLRRVPCQWGGTLRLSSVVRRLRVRTPNATPTRSFSILWRPSGRARGRAVLASGGRVRRRPSPGWLRGWRRQAACTGGKGQTDSGGGVRAGVSQSSLMRGWPADGTLRKLPLSWRRGLPVCGDLRRWNGVEWKRGPVVWFTGWRWNVAEWKRL